jgi:sterol 3beta-glucosyltransferase
VRVLVLTLGTRGDVQPFVALAQQLRQRGHEVVVAAPHRFTGLVEGHGVTFAGIDDGPLRLLDDGTAVGDVATGGLGAKLALMRRMPAMFTRVLDDCWQVASAGAGAGADLIVHNGQVMAGQHVAEKLDIPAVLAMPMPMYVPTREFPWPGQQLPSWLPAPINRLTYAGMKAPALMFGRTVDRWRSGHGLPRRSGRHDPSRRPDGQPALGAARGEPDGHPASG